MTNTQYSLGGAQRRNVLLSFGLGAALVLRIYLVLGFWPFGDGTMLTGDLNGQYVAYLADLKGRLAEGGFFYSFSKLCGGSTLGLFAYYMASPFNLLILLAPVRMIPQMVQLMFLLRVACTGAACCFFLQKHFNSASPLLPFLSQGYALCAYCVVYSQNVIWMDVVLLAPLVLWAVERLVDTGRHWPLFWLVFACILLNFYTAWEVCLFSVLYFFWYWATSPRLEGRGAKLLGRRFGAFAASGLLAAGLAMALLYPALVEIEETKGALFGMDFTLGTNFSLPQLVYQFFFGNFFWEDVTNGLPNVYCGVFCAALAVLFFLSGKVARREKLAAAGLLAVMVLSFWVNGLDLIWHGFKEPVWFPYRYSFLFSLFLLLLAGRVLLEERPRLWALAAAAALGAVWLAGYRFTSGETFSMMKLVMCAGLWFGTLACLWLMGLKKTGALLGAAGFCCLACGDMAAYSVLALRKFETYPKSGFESFYDENTAVVDAVRELDDGYYRIEKNYMRTLNDPMLLGYWGISHFSSTKASTAKPMLEQMGYVNYTIYGWGSTAVADSLLGIKYLYTDGSRPLPAGYEPLETGTALTVAENPWALPMAWAGSDKALEVDVEASANTFRLQNEMLSALVPGTPDALLAAEDVKFDDEASGIGLWFTVPVSGPCYLAVPDTGNFLPGDVKVDGELLGEYFQGDSLGGVFPLGSLEAGQRVYFELGVEDKPEYREKIQIYSLDTQVLTQAADALKASAASQLSIREGGAIDLVIEGGEGRELLVLPFAYEDGGRWTARRNGEEVPVEQVFEGMMGVRLEEGENSVQLRYHHPGAGVGAAVSAVSAVAAAVWFAAEKRRAKGGKTA